MNKNQRIVLGLGLLLIILNGLFPPFEAEIRGTEKDWPTTTKYLGYHLLFKPPSQADVFGGLYDIKTISDRIAHAPTEIWEQVQNAAPNELSKLMDSIRVHIAMSYFIVQIVTIVSLITGACILFRRSNVMDEGK